MKANLQNPSKKPLPVNIKHPIAGVTLCFCPFCLTGHLLDEGQKTCDICGTKLIWPKKKTK